MNGPEILVSVVPELELFVPHARRGGAAVPLVTDGVSTLGHVIESLGVPLTEVGVLVVDGREAAFGHIPVAGERVEVRAVVRPQRVGERRCGSCSMSISARWHGG